MTVFSDISKVNPNILRGSDGCPVHPGHAQFHIVRLLVGSLFGGWSIMLGFMLLGFLGNFDFTRP